MKKWIIPLILGLFGCSTQDLIAQTFNCVGNNIQQQSLQFELANEVFIYFENKTADTLRLKWRRLEFQKPNEWGMALCDWGTCYVGVPTSGTMNFLPPTEKAYLKLIVQPGNTAGRGWLWFRVWNVLDENDFVDVYFSLHTPGTSALDDAAELVVQIFPNPVSDFLYVKNATEMEQTIVLLDANGRIIHQKKVIAHEISSIDMQHQPAGMYHFLCGQQRFTVVKQ